MGEGEKKRPRARPPTVPEDARYDAASEEWESGARVHGKNVGAWRWWRKDGSLLCESTFENGLLHGPFARYHPDGTKSRTGTFDLGEQVGTEIFVRGGRGSSEHFPVDSRSVAKVTVDHDAAGSPLRFFDARGRETTELGILLSKWQNDALFADARPDRFLAHGFAEYLRAYHSSATKKPRARGGARTRAHVRELEEFEEVWGLALPDDLRTFVELTSSLSEKVHEIRPAFGSPRLPPRTKNLVETCIVEDQQGFRALALTEALSGTVTIGEAASGDQWQFGLFDHLHSDARGSGQVYLWNHEERTLCDPISPDLSTFVYLNCICEAHARGVLTPKAFGVAYRRLAKRVATTWHYAELEARAVPDRPDTFRYKSAAILPRFMFFRALWIGYLLRNQGSVTVDDMPRVFVESANEPITDQSWPAWLTRAKSAVPTALYVLFRCFFFDDAARLAEAVRVLENNPARMIRDAAKLASELQDGRKQLGTIRNMKKLKADFMALDLDPNRREQRERERRAEAKAAESQPRSVKEVAEKLAGVSLEEVAWGKLDDVATHEDVVRAMRDLPEMRETFAVIDYIDGDGHAHDGLILEHEREEALLAMGELGSRAIVPILVGRARRGDRKAVEMLAALKDPRAVPHLLALLDGRADRYHHFDTAVVHALRSHGARGAVPKLLAILARNPLLDWKTGIERGDLVQEVVLALGSLGDRSAVPALLKVLAAGNKEYDEVLPLAAGALGALGAKDAKDLLAERLDRTKDGASAEDIWAYGEVVKNASGVDLARQRLAGLSSIDPAAEVVRSAALVKLGATPGAYEEALAHALTLPGNRKVDTSRQRIWAWRCVGEIGMVPPDVETHRHYLTTDDHGVRAAATRALARQGIACRETRSYFLFALPALEAQGGLEALHAAACDPWGIFRYNVALRLARIGDPSSVRVLCRAIRELYAEPVTSTYEYDDPPFHVRWFARALGSFSDPEAAACLIEGLASANHHVRQVIASDPPKDDRVVSALVRLLDDPRALLRSRAQLALETFKRTTAYARAMDERDRLAEI